MWNVRIGFGRDKALKTRLQSRETEKEVREKWHLRADTANLFTEQGGKFKWYIVYNSDVSTDRAVTLADELGSIGMVQDVAVYFRNMIAVAF